MACHFGHSRVACSFGPLLGVSGLFFGATFGCSGLSFGLLWGREAAYFGPLLGRVACSFGPLLGRVACSFGPVYVSLRLSGQGILALGTPETEARLSKRNVTPLNPNIVALQ